MHCYLKQNQNKTAEYSAVFLVYLFVKSLIRSLLFDVMLNLASADDLFLLLSKNLNQCFYLTINLIGSIIYKIN